MKKILVVDDEPDIREVIKMLLQMNSYKVKTLESGKNLTGVIDDYQPDLILMDIMLGGEDGRDLCLSLKKDPQTTDIPVILCSAYQNLLGTSEEYLADGVIAKPFELRDMLDVISQSLQ